MNTLIPLESYTAFYYYVILIVVFLVFFQTLQASIGDVSNLKKIRNISFVVFVFTLLYMGFRPISFIFGDMAVYAIKFVDYAKGGQIYSDKDVLFEKFIQFCSTKMSAEFFFFVCVTLYVTPMYIVSRRWFKDYFGYAFIMFIASFSFWAYGTNGIRNGIATSFFLLGISQNKKVLAIGIVLLSVFIHKSLMVPSLAFLITYYYNVPKKYLIFWFIAIPLSLALGSFWENFFLNFGFGDEERLTGYLTGDDSGLDKIVQLKVGFRWDFLLYSAIGVYAGWFFIFIKKFEDVFYNRLFSAYLIANSFWIFVIRANFSNRFAYLSWFMLGIVIIYPLLKVQLFENQNKVIGRILVVYFLFSFVLNVILVVK